VSLSGPSLDLIAPIRPLQLCADGGYQLRLGVLGVPLIMVPDNAEMAEASLLVASEEGGAAPRPVPGAATLSPRAAVLTGGVSCSGSGPVGPRIPSSFLTMSERSGLGTGFMSVSRQRWGRFGRPWRSFAGTFPRSSR
jgi:hypothetical protein